MDRRRFVLTTAAVVAGACVRPRGRPRVEATPVGPRPTPAQLRWQRDELALFLHFGVNTFTDREWGDGTEDPAIFNPARLDARQSARAGGPAPRAPRAPVRSSSPRSITTASASGRHASRRTRCHRARGAADT